MRLTTYRDIKKEILDLIFSDTIAGDEIALSYNNQEDYVQAIPRLINDAQTYVATTVKKIPATFALDHPTGKIGEFDVYTMPANFWTLMAGGLLHGGRDPFTGQHTLVRFNGFRLIGGNQICVPHGMKGLVAEYYRFPDMLEDEPEDDTELDNTLEVQTAIPYYVAAQLVLYDDYFRYSALFNSWEARLARITEPMFTEVHLVEDVYGGFGAGF